MATIDYKKKIKDYMNSSEVDTLYKSMLNNLFPELAESEEERIMIWIKNELESKYVVDNIVNNVMADKALAWLEKQCEKETKWNEREIPNHAWSGEDEDNMMMIEDRLSDYLDYIREDTSLTKHQKNSMKEEVIGYDNWFKSLRERYTWKPNDEQITWLYRAADDVSKDSRMKQILNELLSDLKKLREE